MSYNIFEVKRALKLRVTAVLRSEGVMHVILSQCAAPVSSWTSHLKAVFGHFDHKSAWFVQKT